MWPRVAWPSPLHMKYNEIYCLNLLDATQLLDRIHLRPLGQNMTFTGYHTVPHQPPGQLNAGARLTFKLSEEIKQLAQEGRRRSHHNSKEIAGRKHRIEANGSNNENKYIYLKLPVQSSSNIWWDCRLADADFLNGHP